MLLSKGDEVRGNVVTRAQAFDPAPVRASGSRRRPQTGGRCDPARGAGTNGGGSEGAGTDGVGTDDAAGGGTQGRDDRGARRFGRVPLSPSETTATGW